MKFWSADGRRSLATYLSLRNRIVVLASFVSCNMRFYLQVLQIHLSTFLVRLEALKLSSRVILLCRYDCSWPVIATTMT